MLQLDVTQRHNTIYICPKVCIGGPKADQTIEFETWRQCLFGNRLYYGLCHKTPWTNNDWEYADNHMIEASSLDELELELAIRGF